MLAGGTGGVDILSEFIPAYAISFVLSLFFLHICLVHTQLYNCFRVLSTTLCRKQWHDTIALNIAQLFFSRTG